jgi:AmiR/NasT family two-component response regulator
LPIILISAYHEDEMIERAETDHIMAYLVKPIKEADLQPAIALAMRRFQQFQALQQEASDLRQALEDRKIIERAKGVLMKRAAVDEETAFRRLQKLATERRCKLVEVARLILAVETISQPGEQG